MKKTAMVLMAIIFSLVGHAQDCKAYVFNKGQQLTFEFKTYPLTFESDMSMITGDTKYKVKNSISFNQKIASGKIAAKTTSVMTVKVNNVNASAGGTEYDLMIGGLTAPVDVKSYCGHDSLVSVMYGGRMAYVQNGDTSGLMLFGANYYVAEPKVGSRVRGTTNLTMIADKSQLEKLRKFYSTPFNSRTTSPADWYETITNVTGPVQATMFSFTIQQPALVLKEDKLTIAGKEYPAFVLGTETWSKAITTKPERSFYEMEMEYLQLPDMSKKVFSSPSFEPGGKRVWEKKSGEMLDVNKQGFNMGYKEEWFVTGLGVVKSVTYDANGAILATSELKTIE